MLNVFSRAFMIAARAPYEIRPVESTEELRSEDRRSLRRIYHAPNRRGLR
ncbi:hypothetical protein [Oricola sp.]